MLAEVRSNPQYQTASRVDAALAQKIADDVRFAGYWPLSLARHVIDAQTSRKPVDLSDPALRPTPILD